MLRSQFITMADICRIEVCIRCPGAPASSRDTCWQAEIEAEDIRLHPKDGESVRLWVDNLRKQGAVLSFKGCDDAPPDGSGLESGCFNLIIQTEEQRKHFKDHGNNFAGMDGTHNTTHYDGMTLYTMMVRDRWGHGALQVQIMHRNLCRQVCLSRGC